MYIPHQFKNENLAEVKAFIQENSFAILTNIVDQKPWATHIPLELDRDKSGKDILYGHIAKVNKQWKNFTEAPDVLAIFPGPHAYVSSSWYSHENVPTWNYIAVHIYGKIEIIGKQELYDSLKKLIDKYEANSKAPIRMETFSEKTLRQMNGIIGFKIHIETIQAAYKLSQNRNEADHKSIINELSTSKDQQVRNIAAIMNEQNETDD